MPTAKWATYFAQMSVVVATAGVLNVGLIHGQAPAVPQTDPALVERGRTLYAKDCASCHGNDGRGGSAPDLIRSEVVLHDRGQNKQGANFGPVLSTAPHAFKYDQKQLKDLSQFLTFNVNGILRSGPSNRPSNLLAGNATTGGAFFQKNCASCHSTTGDLAGIGKRFDPAAIQQRFVFPNRIIGGVKKKTQVTVELPGANAVTGALIRIDDFHVTLRLPSGVLQSFTRGPKVKVKVDDPLVGHYELLDRYTDDDIHNMTTYLETLK
jgi:cytochrome c oxidase cbb3-type subunit 3